MILRDQTTLTRLPRLGHRCDQSLTELLRSASKSVRRGSGKTCSHPEAYIRVHRAFTTNLKRVIIAKLSPLFQDFSFQLFKYRFVVLARELVDAINSQSPLPYAAVLE